MSDSAEWPRLTYQPHKAALETLQLWTQIVGKIRLAQTPWLNLNAASLRGAQIADRELLDNLGSVVPPWTKS